MHCIDTTFLTNIPGNHFSHNIFTAFYHWELKFSNLDENWAKTKPLLFKTFDVSNCMDSCIVQWRKYKTSVHHFLFTHTGSPFSILTGFFRITGGDVEGFEGGGWRGVGKSTFGNSIEVNDSVWVTQNLLMWLWPVRMVSSWKPTRWSWMAPDPKQPPTSIRLS